MSINQKTSYTIIQKGRVAGVRSAYKNSTFLEASVSADLTIILLIHSSKEGRRYLQQIKCPELSAGLTPAQFSLPCLEIYKKEDYSKISA